MKPLESLARKKIALWLERCIFLYNLCSPGKLTLQRRVGAVSSAAMVARHAPLAPSVRRTSQAALLQWLHRRRHHLAPMRTRSRWFSLAWPLIASCYEEAASSLYHANVLDSSDQVINYEKKLNKLMNIFSFLYFIL